MKHLSLFLLWPALLSGAETLAAMARTGCERACRQRIPTGMEQDQERRLEVGSAGRGHSSPVHDKGMIWITTALETPASEAEKKERLKDNKGLPTVVVLSKVSLRALQIDPKSGKVLQNAEIFERSNPNGFTNSTVTLPTPRSSRTEKVYFHFGAYGNACIDAKPEKSSGKTTRSPFGSCTKTDPAARP